MYNIDQKTREQITNNEHLNLLSIFYYVFGGLSLLGALVFFIYIVVVYFIFNQIPELEELSNSEAKLAFNIISVVFIILMLLMIIAGILFIVSGLNLRKKNNRTLSIVMAVVAMLSFPLGTALGIFTIIVLTRDSVVEMYRLEPEMRKQKILHPDGL